ncbi:hypothetical protein BD324DRAFT_633670 [Kockovaella imperatae]|uniref:Uncharacterized protein n=1 Tax=Kockovaella imperatae TaxID=4999 RepID=A0A1Y1UBW9_9TREE|nr:hypothetical protein BD324DRAFT_633670 [Kockovaella imperatae]ORX35034.1 hypothetical protein BD324DRAFT_633670 [Kockovaella imperatae]
MGGIGHSLVVLALLLLAPLSIVSAVVASQGDNDESCQSRSLNEIVEPIRGECKEELGDREFYSQREVEHQVDKRGTKYVKQIEYSGKTFFDGSVVVAIGVHMGG